METWTNSMYNELGRLYQGAGKLMPTGPDTVKFISKYEVSKGKFATYARIVCRILLPQKAEIHRTQLKVGGNLTKHLHNVIMPASEISTVK